MIAGTLCPFCGNVVFEESFCQNCYAERSFYLYSSAVRSRLEIRAPYLEAIKATAEELKELAIWAHYPCIITDENKSIVADNGL